MIAESERINSKETLIIEEIVLSYVKICQTF